MRCRSLLPLILPFGLAACWTGEAWFAPADGVAAIPQGTYRLVERGSEIQSGDQIQVSRQPDGSFIVDGPDRPWQAIIVPLGKDQPDRYLIQLKEVKDHKTNPLFVLLDRTNGAFHIMILPCDSFVSKAAQGHVSIARDPNAPPSCTFDDKATMMRGLRRYGLGGRAAEDVDLVPVTR